MVSIFKAIQLSALVYRSGFWIFSYRCSTATQKITIICMNCVVRLLKAIKIIAWYITWIIRTFFACQRYLSHEIASNFFLKSIHISFLQVMQAKFGQYRFPNSEEDDNFELSLHSGLGLWLTIGLTCIITVSFISIIFILLTRWHRQRDLKRNNRRFTNGGIL